MGYKAVCFHCRKAFSGYKTEKPIVCPECGGEVFAYPHRFRPPEKNDVKKWAVVESLRQSGLYYQHIHEEYEHIDENGQIRMCAGNVKYPEHMREAKEFVIKYGKHV